MKYYILTILTVVSIALFAKSDPKNTKNEVANWEAPWVPFSNYFQYNPAATFALPQVNLNEVRTSYLFNRADDGLHLVQDGDGASALKLSSESFQKDSCFRFFGKAYYINDQKNNVVWRDVEDRVLLAPYFIADSIGGTYKREAYSLSGGATIRTANFEWGIRGTYTGGVSYRKVDPRPRNTVSEIQVNPGVTYFKGNWRMGLFGEYTRYRQNVDIQVEKEDRKIFFYLLQGFGNYNRQFSILAESFTRTYKGNLFNAGFHINNNTKDQASGVLIMLKTSDIQVNEKDKRIPYKLKHFEIVSQITHERKAFNRNLFLKGNYNFHQTIGNETQYYPTTINTSFVVWNFLTQADRYQSRKQQAQFTALLANKNTAVFSVWEQLHIGWMDSKDNYYVPDYHQNIQDITASGTLGFTCPIQKTLISGSVLGGYKKNISSSLVQLDNNIIVNQLTIPDFNFLSSDIQFYQLNLKFRFPISKNSLISIGAMGSIQSSVNQHAYQTSMSVALNY